MDSSEKIVGIFNYCAWPTYGGAKTVTLAQVSINQLIFTDRRLLMKKAEDLPGTIKNDSSLKAFFFGGSSGGGQWAEFKSSMVPKIDRSQKFVTKDMLKSLSYWRHTIYDYNKISKIQISNNYAPEKLVASFMTGDSKVSIYFTFLPDEASVEFYITKDSVQLLTGLIRQTPLAEKLET